MKSRVLNGCLIATLMISGLAGCGSGEGAEATGKVAATPASTNEGVPSAGQAGKPVIPSIEVSGDANQARMLTEINQAMADVTKEALSRPKDDRMTAEEIDLLIRSRIEQIKAKS